MHASEGESGRVQLRLVEAPGPDPGQSTTEGDAAPGHGPCCHLALVGDEGQPELVALPSPISPGKARAVQHYARLAAEARSARAD